jgi:hypothetical protein
MTTKIVLGTSGSIADLDSATASERAVLTTGVDTVTAKLYISNLSDEAVFLVKEDDATTSGMIIPAGGGVEYGPFEIAQFEAYLYGGGTGSARYTWNPVRSEN